MMDLLKRRKNLDELTEKQFDSKIKRQKKIRNARQMVRICLTQP